MLNLFICAIFLFTGTDVVYSKYQSAPQGWIAQHKVATTWDEAYRQCQREGAVLASPVSKELRDKMQSLIGANNALYFTGTKFIYSKEILTTVEGAILDDMPVSDLYTKLDSKEGDCLAMDSNSLRVVPCSSRLPYMCYKKKTSDMTLTNCGTYDKDYIFKNATGSCYKIHYNRLNWLDAYKTCIAEGAYLAIVNDYAEAQMLVKDIIIKREFYLWIGLVDWMKTNDFKSIHGHPINQLHQEWETKPKTNTTDNCGAINPLLNNQAGKLKPLQCFETITYFVCEKNPTNIQFLEDYDETNKRHK